MTRDHLAWHNGRPGWHHRERSRIFGRVGTMLLVWAAAFVWCITGD